LTFESESRLCGRRRIRRTSFESKSSLPASAACLVANAVRETLGTMISNPVTLSLTQPVLPQTSAWRAICAEAVVSAVSGPLCDAALLLRRKDAVAFAAMVFDESCAEDRELSPLERSVVLRALRAFASALAPLCGRELAAVQPCAELRGYTTYFEIRIERPIACRLGVALSKDPAPAAGPALRLDDLLDVEVELCGELTCGALAADRFLDLTPGATVPMTTEMDDLGGSLRAGGVVLAHGACGALAQRRAIRISGLR
jgi:hypothetical protein